MSTFTRALYLFMSILNHGGDGLEPTDRLVPATWQGNPWGPAANQARATGQLPPIVMTDRMKAWDRWGRASLRTGDMVFRRGDARILFGYFPFSRFLANATGSRFSHVATVVVEDGAPFMYDTTKAGVRRQPFHVWVLDDVDNLGVKRLKAQYRSRIPAVVDYVHRTYQQQVPFDYNLSPDDKELYCVEMAEKAFRAAGLPLSEPVRIRDMERIHEFPISVFVIHTLSWFALSKPLTMDVPVYCPGNERHGIWGSPYLETVYPTDASRHVQTAESVPKPIASRE